MHGLQIKFRISPEKFSMPAPAPAKPIPVKKKVAHIPSAMKPAMVEVNGSPA